MTRPRSLPELLALIPRPATEPASTAGSGPDGNSRLTSTTGMVLLVLLAVEGFTLLDVRGLISLHVFVGTLLAGPLLVKLVSTSYRFGRYYLRAEPYVHRGPPMPLLRVLGPLVTISSIALIGSGLGLLAVGRGDLMLTLHKGSFIVWFAVMVVHVLGHLWEAAVGCWRELRQRTTGQLARLAVLVVSLLAGVAVAVAVLPAAAPWHHRPAEAQEHHRLR